MEVIHWRRSRFQWKRPFSVGEILRKISPMSDEGEESCSDGIHQIHWTQIDSDGKVHILLCET